MRKKLILVILTSWMVTCDVHTENKSAGNATKEVTSRNRIRDDYPFGLSSVPNNSSTFTDTYHKTEKHKRRRRHRRCRREIESFYRVPNFQPNYNRPYQVPPNYIPQEYILPSRYIPTRCHNFCRVCPLPSCARRCPVVTPTFRPHPTSSKRPWPTTRTTPRTRTTPSTGRTRTTTASRTTPSIKTTTTRTTPSTRTTARGTVNASNSVRPNALIKLPKPPLMLNKNPCLCDPDGSKYSSCNARNGACVCNPHFTGISCAYCENGYWKQSRRCVECKCNKNGTSRGTVCDRNTGRCRCKPGVTGYLCDSCLPHHYGTVETGCRKCDPCNKKGHFCDPTSGKCVCPSFTTGIDCERCTENAWKYDSVTGCEACNCSTFGSVTSRCDQTRGICTCKVGYGGVKCSRCSYGYYGYPNCRRCSCDPRGTEVGQCRNGMCRCEEDGSCKCKENVQGKHCDRCKMNNYGLAKENPEGCSNCFCFGRTTQCEDALHRWNEITRMKRSLEDDNEVNGDELMLPKTFMGDITSSYGGNLVVDTDGRDFEILLEGNSVELRTASHFNKLQLVESGNWRVTSKNPYFPNSCIDRLTRSCLMVVLQKVTRILVKANSRIMKVTLDKASGGETNFPVTHTIEKCRCPKEYTGLSCQNPNRGYYRYFPRDQQSSWIDRVVGVARKCECGGHSSECDAETGFCKNCGKNTTGNHCEKCTEGLYMDKNGNCAPCLCPSVEQNNAKSCAQTEETFRCECKEGYTGIFCEKCGTSFYRKQNSTVCEPCKCNPLGIIPETQGSCDNFGKCRCRNGFNGVKCDQCTGNREYFINGFCERCDECTMKLLDLVDILKKDVENVFELFKNGTGPPWKNLTETIDKLDGLSEKHYDRLERFDTLLEKANLTGYRAKITQMEKKLNRNNIEANNNLHESEKLLENSTRLLEETEDLGEQLVSIIEVLGSSGTKQMSLEEALDRARGILEKIEEASKKFINYSNDTLSFCSKVAQKVAALYTGPSNIPKNKLEGLKKKLEDLSDVISFVENLAKLAEAKNNENAKGIERLKGKIETLNTENENHEVAVGGIIKKSDAITDMLDKLSEVYADLETVSDFEEFKEVENRVKRQMKEIPQIQQIYSKAVQHVKELEAKVNEYHSLFNFTKDEWKKINASGAYEAIIAGIEEARTSMKESKKVLKNAITLLDPKNTDGLDDRTDFARAYSDRLKKKISNLTDISKNLSELQNKLVELKYGISKNGKANNNLTQIVLRINDDITSQTKIVLQLEEALKNMSKISKDMESIQGELEEMSLERLTDLLKKYQNSAELAVPKEIASVIGNVSDVRKKLQTQAVLPEREDEYQERTNRLEKLRNDMELLQSKIKQAKQHVDAIEIAMDLNNCQMSYRLSDPQLFQSLAITFKCQECMLFKWSKSNKEVLKLAAQNQAVTVSAEGKAFDIPFDITKETVIHLTKVGALLKAQIDDEEKSEIVTEMPVISPEDILEIGSLTTKSVPDKEYVAKVLLNENYFGIWKFTNSSGSCKGLNRNITSVDTGKRSFFNGKGYREYGINQFLSPRELALKFYFNTFDENATIYVSIYEKNCSYIALFLKNGHVNFVTKHSNGQEVLLSKKLRVNNALRHNIEIGMTFEKGIQTYSLVVDGQEPKIVDEQLNKKNVFKIKEARHYLGGVPPTFNKACVPIDTASLLGFLGQTSQKYELTNETISYGIIKTSRDAITFNKAWIHPSGQISIEAAFGKLHSISFILRPVSSSGVIMKFDKLNQRSINTIALSDLKLAINGVEYNFTSLTLNDYNNVELKMTKEDKSLTINGKTEKLEDTKRMVMDWVQIGEETNGFSGGIREIVINERLLAFNATTVKNFSNVEIGKEKPLPKLTSSAPKLRSLSIPNLSNSMQNTERCIEFNSPNPIQGADKFLGRPDSYVHVKTNFWRKDRALQFDFRTFSPDGLIFITRGRRSRYISLELQDGQLWLNKKAGKKKFRSLPVASNLLSDGEWHVVQLKKTKNKLLIKIDNTQKKTRFSINVADEIYFGGDPHHKESSRKNRKIQSLHFFRGCMKSHFFSEGSDELVTRSNVGRCFSNVEEGAYFNGNSYGTITNFRVDEMMELSFEFRTSEQNGILLSVSNHGDSPALSVELQNGAIVMAVNVGNGVVSNVTNNLDSAFSLCNNRWHNVTAVYSTSELTVNVDGIRKSWVVSDVDSGMGEMEAPLYIGGLPDDAPKGTSKSPMNFKGCLKKLRVNSELVDWSEMKKLKDIMLDSCPTDHS
ncbi:laminin subunit alpha-2 isoform X2 [Leptinotarsa decemlineata]|uniref:laminin subunit alpha-2 isoform X2 n=1 Tax=Leptinotarsa decemlineata TaxID=7539 RepID=UPI003D3057D7